MSLLKYTTSWKYQSGTWNGYETIYNNNNHMKFKEQALIKCYHGISIGKM